jgi:Flp pilus assembly protein TadG
MKLRRSIIRDENGATVIETAFALPVLIVFVWMMVQLAQVYRALAGIQQALGEGARYATLCMNPDAANGCKVPSKNQVEAKMTDSVYGIGPGTFTPTSSALTAAGTGSYYDLTVSYAQNTTLLLFPGPRITVSRSKRVWLAGTAV